MDLLALFGVAEAPRTLLEDGPMLFVNRVHWQQEPDVRNRQTSPIWDFGDDHCSIDQIKINYPLLNTKLTWNRIRIMDEGMGGYARSPREDEKEKETPRRHVEYFRNQANARPSFSFENRK